MSDDKNRIDQLARDIEFLKTAVNRGNPVVRNILHNARDYYPLAIVASILFTITGFGFQAVIFLYGGFALVPPLFALAGIACIAAVFILVSVWKISILSKKAKEAEGGGMSFFGLFSKFFSGSFLHIQISFALALFSGGIFLAWKGQGWYILPLIGVYFGITCNHFASNYELPEFRILGYATLGIGIGILPFIDFAPFFCFGLLLGGTLLAFALAFRLVPGKRPGKHKEK